MGKSNKKYKLKRNLNDMVYNNKNLTSLREIIIISKSLKFRNKTRTEIKETEVTRSITLEEKNFEYYNQYSITKNNDYKVFFEIGRLTKTCHQLKINTYPTNIQNVLNIQRMNLTKIIWKETMNL